MFYLVLSTPNSVLQWVGKANTKLTAVDPAAWTADEKTAFDTALTDLKKTILTLLTKINSKSANIAVIGLGYVGLPLVIEFCRAGFHVTGFDVDEQKIALLRQGKSYIKHISATTIAPLVLPLPRRERGGVRVFTPTTDFTKLAAMDCIIICVPTPLNKNREPDMRYVFDTAGAIAQYLRKDQLVVLGSTTYPGTTDQDVRAILEKGGLKAGTDFHLAFSPEREDPNNKDFGLSSGKTGATPYFLFSENRELYRLFRPTGRKEIIGSCPPFCPPFFPN